MANVAYKRIFYLIVIPAAPFGMHMIAPVDPASPLHNLGSQKTNHHFVKVPANGRTVWRIRCRWIPPSKTV
jgi:hypothetical protein